ncbi:hypothetical protein [Pandoraea captiosa]|jgi:hypothetical protein|uniref:hypothetical protein n=1 Tax=Pandoraea captiosa TaxID=2508302 RepID=UPI0012413E2C|nr:hypothetical protein [Pandoraea captiosa]
MLAAASAAAGDRRSRALRWEAFGAVLVNTGEVAGRDLMHRLLADLRARVAPIDGFGTSMGRAARHWPTTPRYAD